MGTYDGLVDEPMPPVGLPRQRRRDAPGLFCKQAPSLLRAGSGLLRALRAWRQIELIGDRAGNLFKAIVVRHSALAARRRTGSGAGRKNLPLAAKH